MNKKNKKYNDNDEDDDDTNTIGHFNIVRLKSAMYIIDNDKKQPAKEYYVKKNSIGITMFEPYVGLGVYFEGLPKKLLVPLDTKNMQYVFKNIRSTIAINHIRDDVDI